MFNLGLPETIIILGAALLVFGPKRLPELAKGLGKGIRDFKKAVNGEEENETPPQPPVPERLPPENTAARPAPHMTNEGESTGTKKDSDPSKT